MQAYKLMALNADGTLSPAFSDTRLRYAVGAWHVAEDIPAARRRIKARRSVGFHCVAAPAASHIDNASAVSRRQNRVWVEVTLRGSIVTRDRPACQGGRWLIASEMRIDRIIDR